MALVSMPHRLRCHSILQSPWHILESISYLSLLVYDPTVSLPNLAWHCENLILGCSRILQNAETRQRYLSPSIGDGNIRHEARRRLDRIMLHNGNHVRQIQVFRPTAHAIFAGLTDHLPLSLKIVCQHAPRTCRALDYCLPANY
jgi:hypothetical protein